MRAMAVDMARSSDVTGRTRREVIDACAEQGDVGEKLTHLVLLSGDVFIRCGHHPENRRWDKDGKMEIIEPFLEQ